MLACFLLVFAVVFAHVLATDHLIRIGGTCLKLCLRQHCNYANLAAQFTVGVGVGLVAGLCVRQSMAISPLVYPYSLFFCCILYCMEISCPAGLVLVVHPRLQDSLSGFVVLHGTCQV